MSVVLTRSEVFSNVIKWLGFPGDEYHFEAVTVNIAAGATLSIGTVLAKLAASGKYIVQDASLATGLGLDNLAVLIGTDENNFGAVIPAATDTTVLVLSRGPAKVAKEQLIMAAATDTAAEKLAVYNDLASKGIIAVTQI